MNIKGGLLALIAALVFGGAVSAQDRKSPTTEEKVTLHVVKVTSGPNDEYMVEAKSKTVYYHLICKYKHLCVRLQAGHDYVDVMVVDSGVSGVKYFEPTSGDAAKTLRELDVSFGTHGLHLVTRETEIASAPTKQLNPTRGK